jgi:acetylornithine deacetylase
LLGPATVSVGSISGGTQPNIVPASCVAWADRRTLPGETDQSVFRELKALLRRRGLRASLQSEKPSACPPLETDPRLPLVRKFLQAAGQKKPAGVNYFCDAAILAQSGMPSVVFGPGDIAQAHTADEWIALSSLERAAQLLLKFFLSLP